MRNVVSGPTCVACIEIDGSQHLDANAADLVRTRRLEAAGFRVLRFWNHEAFLHLDEVLGVIDQTLHQESQ